MVNPAMFERKKDMIRAQRAYINYLENKVYRLRGLLRVAFGGYDSLMKRFEVEPIDGGFIDAIQKELDDPAIPSRGLRDDKEYVDSLVKGAVREDKDKV